MKLLVLLFFTVMFSSCQHKQLKENTAPENVGRTEEKSSNAITDSTDNKARQPILPPGTEDAETLAARYYSTRNREKLYPFYKGLGLKVLEIDRITGTDSFRIQLKVTGRKWPNPNKDTLTIPFEENRTIRAIKTEKGWQADSINLK
jgi:hypothetical protein